jgi:hypothetical protein
MHVEKKRWSLAQGWTPEPLGQLADSAQLVLAFGSTAVLRNPERIAEIVAAYPTADLMACSTSGNILGTEVSDATLVLAAIHFEDTPLHGARVRIDEVGSSFQAGEKLAAALPREELVHVFVLSDGLRVNGSDLVRGLTSGLPQDVTVTGGLSGDGDQFRETLVAWNGPAESGNIAALGFYGKRLRVGYASLGGWDPFGPERLITRSKGNVLFELDGQSALDLYKKYLGEHAAGLPATGLLFPLSLRTEENTSGVVRTILSVNEQDGSMTFAGDVPEGALARLMKANFDRLIDGAAGAARTCYEAVGSTSPDLAILISCVGRKLLLKQRVEEEVESVRAVLGDHTTMTGFYSYGEISPFTPNARCELHNQTMTITTFSEP